MTQEYYSLTTSQVNTRNGRVSNPINVESNLNIYIYLYIIYIFIYIYIFLIYV